MKVKVTTLWEHCRVLVFKWILADLASHSWATASWHYAGSTCSYVSSVFIPLPYKRFSYFLFSFKFSLFIGYYLSVSIRSLYPPLSKIEISFIYYKLILLECKIQWFWYSHTLMQTSALSNSRIFLHSQRNLYPLVHLHFLYMFSTAPLCRFIYSGYFIHTGSYKTAFVMTSSPTNDLKVVLLVLHFSCSDNILYRYYTFVCCSVRVEIWVSLHFDWMVFTPLRWEIKLIKLNYV